MRKSINNGVTAVAAGRRIGTAVTDHETAKEVKMKRKVNVGTAVGKACCGRGNEEMKKDMDKATISKILDSEDPGKCQSPSGFFKSWPDFVDYVYGLQKDGDWKMFMLSFPPPTWLLVFVRIMDRLDDRTYYELLGPVISTCTGGYRHELAFLIYSRGRKYREFMMEPAERQVLATLDTNIIYRGCCPKNRDGYYWTLDLKEARYFAIRYVGKGAMVLRGEFDKSDVIAYFERDKEIFIDPRQVRNITVFEMQKEELHKILDLPKGISALIEQDSVYKEFSQEAEFSIWFINKHNHGNLEALGPDFKREVIASMSRRRKGVLHAA